MNRVLLALFILTLVVGCDDKATNEEVVQSDYPFVMEEDGEQTVVRVDGLDACENDINGESISFVGWKGTTGLKDNIHHATIRCKESDKLYKIAFDKKGRDFAETDGSFFRVNGLVKIKDGKRHLVVKEYSKLETPKVHWKGDGGLISADQEDVSEVKISFSGVKAVSRSGDHIDAILINRKDDKGYKIILDQKGMKCAEVDGIFVEVSGTVKIKDGMRYILVEEFQ